MTSDDLTPAQAQALVAPVARQLRYLGRLRTRLEKIGVPPADPLYHLVCAAWAAAQALHVDLHYRSCNPASVARAPQPPAK